MENSFLDRKGDPTIWHLLFPNIGVAVGFFRIQADWNGSDLH
jgi:hypothetical protein